MAKVSVIIPGRCEVYFQKTVESCLASAREDIEVIAVVDGAGQNPPVRETDKRVKVINLPESIGQRAAYNLGVRKSQGEIVGKIDAHALLSPGFDVEIKNHMPPRTVVLPEMRRLDVRKWEPKARGKTWFMYPGLDLYCHYWKDYRKRPEAKTEFPEAMTGQGSCWFTTREWNDYIGLLDEGVGSWGNVGIEVSLRTWLQGGSQIVNKNAWQAHWFRVTEGGFPYPMNGRQVAKAHKYTWENYYFKDNAFPHQVRPFRWYIEKFAPVPSWEVYLSDEYQTERTIVYYTDDRIERSLAEAVRKHLAKVAGPIPIVSVSQKPLDFGQNIAVGAKPVCYLSMYEQMLEGVKAAPEKSIVYLCEHDVFYHTSHFCQVPKDERALYVNQNNYYWQQGKPSFVKTAKQKAWSQAVGKREYLLEKLTETVRQKAEKGMKVRWFTWESERPNVDVRHGLNLSPDPKQVRSWKNGVFNLPGWGGPKHFQSITKYKGTMRFDIVRFLIGFYEFSSYLEIGVDRKHTWNQVDCEVKHGVDPNVDCTFRLTSDEFFAQNQNTYDLIFIDGLHEHLQVKRDVENALAILNPGGVIVMHDCKPRNKAEQAVPRPQHQKTWVGDAWKAFVELRRSRPDLEMYVVDTNNGVGIVRRGSQEPLSANLPLTWENLEQNMTGWLNLKSVAEFREHEENRHALKKFKPMSEDMMNKAEGKPGTICQTIREVYHNIGDEALRYQLRVVMAMAKSMHRRLKMYEEQQRA